MVVLVIVVICMVVQDSVIINSWCYLIRLPGSIQKTFKRKIPKNWSRQMLSSWQTYRDTTACCKKKKKNTVYQKGHHAEFINSISLLRWNMCLILMKRVLSHPKLWCFRDVLGLGKQLWYISSCLTGQQVTPGRFDYLIYVNCREMALLLTLVVLT